MSFINLVVRKFIYFIKIENLLKIREIKKKILAKIKINGSKKFIKIWILSMWKMPKGMTLEKTKFQLKKRNLNFKTSKLI